MKSNVKTEKGFAELSELQYVSNCKPLAIVAGTNDSETHKCMELSINDILQQENAIALERKIPNGTSIHPDSLAIFCFIGDVDFWVMFCVHQG